MRYGSSLPIDGRVDGRVPVYGSNGPVGTHAGANTLAPVILIGRKGSHGKLQYAATPIFAIDTTFFVDPSSTRCHLRWLYYALSTLHLDQLTSDVGVPGLSRERAYEQALPLPPPEDQRAIADFLDAETARIDALVTVKRRLHMLLEERGMRLINDLIGADHVVGEDGVPVGVTGRNSVRLGVVARVQTGLTLDANRPQGSVATPLPYLRVANVHDGELDLRDLKEVTVPPELAAGSTLQRGDVLMTEGGDPDKLGRGAVWRGAVDPCLHQNHVFAVRPDPRKLLPDYLALVTRSSYARRYFEVTATKTTGIASTSTSKVAAFRVPLPEISEQRALLHRHHDASRLSQALTARVARQIRLLVEHRQALITAAVRGDMEVPAAAA